MQTLITAFLLISCSSNQSSLQPSIQKCSLNDKAILFFTLPGASSVSSLMLSFKTFTTVDEMSYLEIESQGTTWKTAALKTDSVGSLMAEISSGLIQRRLLPFMSVVLDSSGAEYLLLVSKEGQVSLSSLKFLKEHFLVNLKTGPSVEIKIPSEWRQGTDLASFYLKVN